MKIKKVLIIRFSSFGDIVQCSSVVDCIHQHSSSAQIDWVTKSEFAHLLKLQNGINKIWELDRKIGMKGLIKLGLLLRAENYDHVYDAHNNVRSLILNFLLRVKLTQRPCWLSRSKDRFKRFLLFQLRLNLFPKPFKGIDSYLNPLTKWGIIASEAQAVSNWNFLDSDENIQKKYPQDSKTIVLVPSAAWEMKRWPLIYWKKIVELLSEYNFVILGGREDLFCEEIKLIAPSRVRNLAGILSLVESCAVIKNSHLVISADTGLLHVADILGKNALSLMGPTAFGFTKSPLISTLQIDLSCRPCSKDGRGSCSQDIYQKCMIQITPELVVDEVHRQGRENSFSSPKVDG